MKLERKKYVSLTLGIVSLLIGFCFFRFVSVDLIGRLYNIDSFPKALLLIVGHASVVYWLLKCTFHLKMNRIERVLFLITYLFIMCLAFFDRFTLDSRIVNLNPLDILSYKDSNSLSIIILNILIFIPFYTMLKWNFQKLSLLKTTLFFLVFSISIEILQWFTLRGMFDVVDLLLYMVGYSIGVFSYHIFSKYKIHMIS